MELNDMAIQLADDLGRGGGKRKSTLSNKYSPGVEQKGDSLSPPGKQSTIVQQQRMITRSLEKEGSDSGSPGRMDTGPGNYDDDQMLMISNMKEDFERRLHKLENETTQ